MRASRIEGAKARHLRIKKEKIMQRMTRSKATLNAFILGSALAISACQVAPPSEQGGARGDSVDQYTTQSSGTLSAGMMRTISQVQDLMRPSDGSEPDLEAAKELLDGLAERRLARMNDFEKSTLYNFYTNYYIAREDYEGATNTFEELLKVDTLRPDIRLRSLRSLGQLHSALENWSASIDYYERWQTAANRGDDTVVLRGLSYANYQLENFEAALPHWVDYMTAKRAVGEALSRDDYAYLNGLHFTLENWNEALQITEEMIRLFDTQTDRDNLRIIRQRLEEAASDPSSPVDAG